MVVNDIDLDINILRTIMSSLVEPMGENTEEKEKWRGENQSNDDPNVTEAQLVGGLSSLHPCDAICKLRAILVPSISCDNVAHIIGRYIVDGDGAPKRCNFAFVEHLNKVFFWVTVFVVLFAVNSIATT